MKHRYNESRLRMRILLSCSIAAAAALNAVATGASGETPWKVWPIYGGGYVHNVVSCRTNPDRFYTYVDVGGPYRSDDRCKTWFPLHSNMPVEMRFRGMDQVRTLSVDPRDEDNIVIASGGYGVRAGGMAVSRDGGLTWKPTATACFYGNGFRRMTGYVLDRNPRNPDDLVAGEDWSGIFVSRDNGETWRKTGPEKHWFTDIRYDLNIPGRIYASAPPVEQSRVDNWRFTKEQRQTGREGGFWRSDDNGETWRKIGDSAADEIRQIKGRPEIIGVFGGSSVRISIDGGETWSGYHDGLPCTNGMAAGLIPWRGTFSMLSSVGDDWLAANRSGTIYRRGRNDAEWRELPRGRWQPGCPEGEPRLAGKGRAKVSMPALDTIVVDPADPRHWFATDWFAIWETTDEGASWTSRVKGMMQLVSFTIAFDPFEADNMIYGLADIRMLVTHDGGKSFRVPAMTPFLGCNSAAFSTRVRGLALTAGGKEKSSIMRTRDSGRTWETAAMKGMPPISGGAAGGYGVYTVAYDPYRDAFWACVSGKIAPGAGGPYLSRDAGETWEWSGEGLPADIENWYQNNEWGVKLTPSLVFSSDGSGVTGSSRDSRLFRIGPEGGAWTNPDVVRYRCPLFMIDIAADPFVPGRFICGGDIMQETLDGGKTWHPFAPLAGRACRRVSFDAHNRGTVVFGCEDAILVSYDGGQTLHELDQGLAYPSGGERRMLLDRNRLYGLTSGSGVFTRTLPDKEKQTKARK